MYTLMEAIKEQPGDTQCMWQMFGLVTSFNDSSCPLIQYYFANFQLCSFVNNIKASKHFIGYIHYYEKALYTDCISG